LWILRSKDFVPRCATVDAGSRVTICNHNPFGEKLFSYSRYNKFETRNFFDGQCIHVTPTNPTRAPITFKIFSVIHSQMKLVLIVLPP
jgi:hypothetical protein